MSTPPLELRIRIGLSLINVQEFKGMVRGGSLHGEAFAIVIEATPCGTAVICSFYGTAKYTRLSRGTVKTQK